MSASFRQRLFSDTGLLVLGLVLIVVTAIMLPPYKTPTGARPRVNSVKSDKNGGALALRLWLEEMGYQTEVITASQIDPDDFDVIFVLEPDYPYSPAEETTLLNWVVEGHTLIAAGTDSAINSLITHYGVSLTGWHYTSSLSQTTPALSNPPFATIEPSSAIATITISRPDVAVHLVSESGEPVLVSILYGGGVVWVLGTVYPFTNQGLHTESNARLILNLLAHVPAGAVIGFEEALRTPSEPQAQQQPGGLTAWLVNSRAGWSILAAVGLVMAFLLLRGRRFGQPVPLIQEQLRREPVEFIVAMANLMRRSGHRAEALRYYRAELQRVLAHRYALDPHTPANELARVVAMRDPTIDTAALTSLLQGLSRQSVSEQELVRLVLEVHEWIGDRN